MLLRWESLKKGKKETTMVMGCHFAACSVAVRVAALFPGFWDDFADGVSFAVLRCVFPDLRSGRMK